MSLAVTQIEVGSPPAPQIPPAVGVRLSTADPERYFLFADLGPLDYRYTGDSEKIQNTENIFDRRVRINRLADDNGTNYSATHILFTAPEANLVISDGNGAVIPGEKIDIELASPSGNLTKTITVRLSGQISIKFNVSEPLIEVPKVYVTQSGAAPQFSFRLGRLARKCFLIAPPACGAGIAPGT